jgi:OFA family oxalate/formate antiporter-like MFS transporter
MLFPFVIAMSGNVGFYAYLAVIGLMYGGLISTFPAFVADLFGAKHMATNYGFVLLGFGTAAILATQIAGHFATISRIYDEVGSFVGRDVSQIHPAFLIAAACSFGGILLIWILRIINKKQAAKNS